MNMSPKTDPSPFASGTTVEEVASKIESSEGFLLDEDSASSPEKRREQIFLMVIFDQLLDLFEEDLYDAGAEEEDIDYFRNKISKKTKEEILGVLSLPKDIRTTLFLKMFESNTSGNKAVDAILYTALEGQRKYGFTLGYHVSQKEIEPTKHGWVIQATEFDDRDEMKMAYYSVDYEHFFRKKPAKWIYFVRSETGPHTSHRIDNDNRWSRASVLSIVGKVSLREVDELVEQIAKDTKQKASTTSSGTTRD